MPSVPIVVTSNHNFSCFRYFISHADSSDIGILSTVQNIF